MIYLAETERLFRRTTAIFGLAIAAFCGLLGPGLVFFGNTMAVSFGDQSGQPITAESLAGWDYAVYTSFGARSALILPVIIFLLGGLSMATEFVSKTTREDLLRPVSRVSLFLNKWLALVTWVVAANAVTLALSFGFGFILTFGSEVADEAFVGIGYTLLVTFTTDLGFATLAMFGAVVTRSVGATVASLAVVFAAQVGLAVALMFWSQGGASLVSQFTAVTPELMETIMGWTDWISLWQPPFVLGCQATAQPWQGYVTLAILTIGSMTLGMIRFARMDVP